MCITSRVYYVIKAVSTYTSYNISLSVVSWAGVDRALGIPNIPITNPGFA